MDKSLKWRIAVAAAVLLAALFYALPSFNGGLPSWWTQKKVNLGLDLKGGIHLVMGVDLNVVLENTAGRLADDLRRSMSDKSISAVNVAKGEGTTIEAEFPDQASVDATEALLTEEFPQLGVARRDGLRLTLALTEAETAHVRDMTAAQALETIRSRVDLFGVAEPDIRPQGDDRIVIQLPGMDDPKRAVALIGKTAQLEFKLVDNTRTAEWAVTNGAPAGTEILYQREVDRNGVERRIPYLLKKVPLMTGEGLTDARPTQSGQLGELEVSITFDGRGARQFERVTGEYVNRNMAIVLDGAVHSAPVIRSKISGGRAVISGSFTMEEARDLAVVLRAGALPAPVSVLEERTVGPTLGADSIQMGLRAGLLGLGAVL
ncbi:MAG: protein translocase subunit SecD, partial [Candidatus Adiutrix sp.]|nr:protein translocase subunit SecD [Candidatus Adiutrix sp.]